MQAILAAAPAGRLRLDQSELSALRSAARDLVAGRGALGQREFERFNGIHSRSIDADTTSLEAAHLDLAIGVLATRPSSSSLYGCGAAAGYELAPYPGLYDPMVSGLRSPLFNAFDVAAVEGSKRSAHVDVFQVSLCPEPGIDALVTAICSASFHRGMSPQELRELANRCGWAILRQFLTRVPTGVLARHLRPVDKVPLSEFSPDDATVRSLVRGELSARPDDYPTGSAEHAVSHVGV